MSINVTVNSNPVNIRRGRMVLSDLNQIKKNERDRRRRLRLEQVRQQSKEISNRLVGRVKNIAKEELNKFGKDTSSDLRRQHDKRIMGFQQKFQDDFEDIGQAHVSAALEPDMDEIIEKERQEYRTAALKRGKEALQQMKETHETTISQQQEQQERLRQVRDLENVRSAMIANLPKKMPDADDIENSIKVDEKCKKAAGKKDTTDPCKKLPGKITKTKKQSEGARGKEHSSVARDKSQGIAPGRFDQSDVQQVVRIDLASESESDDKMPRTTIPVCTTTPIPTQKTRYNPEDYTQEHVDSTTSDSSGTVSDDSSYFSDASERTKYIHTPKYVKCPGRSKVRVYDHSTRQRNEYEKPIGVVEKIDVRNEPSAMDLAKEIEQSEKASQELANDRRSSAQRRGEDAMLREKIRRDYQNLMQNLDQFSREERKLKASQVPKYSKDTHSSEQQRRALREHHRKRLDHTMKTIFNCHRGSATSSRRPETVITLKPREEEEKTDKVPNGVWQEACYWNETDRKDEQTNVNKEAEKSRDEQILDMLRKVEKQKRLLLQEFGANLPDDIFNASVKSLFEQNKSTPSSQDTPVQPPLSPEIKVINMSYSGDGETNNDVTKKTKPAPKKVETAVQTMADKSSLGEDKGVQVEVLLERPAVVQSNSSDTDPVSSTNNYIQPIEPKVTVIRPESNSSESSISTLAEVHIDVGNNNVKVTPTKGNSNLRTSKRTGSKVFHKSRSMAARKVSSPVKRLTKSLPASSQATPKKNNNRDVVGTPAKKIDIYVSKNGLNIQVEPSPRPKEAVDACTQSSQAYTDDIEEQVPNRPYRIQSQSRRIIKIKDTSDTSTSYASLPPVRPRSLIKALNSHTPILEMLDSSANESLERRRGEVSPVSTPETPSPRTMMLPSNMPRFDRISKMLKYSAQKQDTSDNTIVSSRNNHSISIDQSEVSSESHTPLQYPATSSKVSLLPPEVCSCKNPECKLMHSKFDDIHSFALKNCPELFQKYEDMQHTCSEKIASLTRLIERLRSERKDMEISAISPVDETSYMQLPWGKTKVNNDLQNVRNLIETLNAINNQLVRALPDGQRTTETEEAIEGDSDRAGESIVEVTEIEDILGDSTVYLKPAIESQPGKGKPKIISEEKVNIQLKRFKDQQRPQDDDVIEQLSKEILEQSAGLSKNGNGTNSFKETNNSLIKSTPQTITNRAQSKGDVFKTSTPSGSRQEENFTREVKKDKDFVPLLDGIPKVPRTTSATPSSVSGRGKPPITLHSAPYRSDIESPGHELSTIVEFDTPDTANKSQAGRSPSPFKKAADPQVKSSVTAKPSVHVAPLFPLQYQHTIAEKSPRSPSMKQLSALPLSTHRSQETVSVGDLPEKLGSVEKSGYAHPETSDSMKPTPKKSDKKLQCDSAGQETMLEPEVKLLDPSVQAENGDESKEDKNKITSSSSNSLSALSGISEITSTPSSEIQKCLSSPEEMETALEKLGLGWAITILKKTRAASALSSSSNSDLTPINTARRMISPPKKQLDSNGYNLPDFSDVSAISIKEASKSTEQAVLLKGRTSTPKLQDSNSNSGTINTSSTNSSDNLQERSDSLIVPNVALTAAKPVGKQLENL